MKRSRLLETSGFNQLAKTRTGYCLYNVNDIYVGQAVEKYGEYGGLEAQLLEQLCGPGDIVIEVGANIGTHTVLLAQRVGASGGVLAFEPQRVVFQTLCANVALNSLTNVECYCAAVGSSRKSVVVPEVDFAQRGNFGAVSLVNAQHGRQVTAVPLDEFTSLPRLKLVKIDVEGMEHEVISGGRRLIDKFKPVLYVENDRVEKSEDLMRLIDSIGYHMYWHTPPLFNPDNFYGDKENIYPNIASFNMLCAHGTVPLNIPGARRITDFSSHPLKKS